MMEDRFITDISSLKRYVSNVEVFCQELDTKSMQLSRTKPRQFVHIKDKHKLMKTGCLVNTMTQY